MRGADTENWLRSAEDDLLWARISLEGGLFTRACFASQQAVEKILKTEEALDLATTIVQSVHAKIVGHPT